MTTRVLVVDDEPAIRELLVEYFRGRGMDVVAVADGEAARLRLQQDPPDVVVTDLKLPGLNGVEVVRAASAGASPVPCVVMTGYGTVDLTVAAFTAGARDYLSKPFRLRDLHDAVERAMVASARDRRAAWAAAAVDLLARADVTEEVADAEALVPVLLALLASAPESSRASVHATSGPDSLPLGATRWLDMAPAVAAHRPYIRAVHHALSRAGR